MSRLLLTTPVSGDGKPADRSVAIPVGGGVDLDERKLVNINSLTINYAVVVAIADYRAGREFDAYAAMGEPRDYHELFGEEALRLLEQADTMIEVRRECVRRDALSPRERLVSQLQFKLHKLRHGLAMPRDDDAIARCEQQLAQAEAQS